MTGLALTFDDGPDCVWTERLLDVLADVDAQATFFPIAPRAAAAPALIERMLEDGHAVGLHCSEHVRHTDRDDAWLRRDTRDALSVLTTLGVEATYWRTPWGITAPWTEGVAQEHGLELIRWSVDTHDWRGDSAEVMLEATRPSLQAGSVVLLHDGVGPGALRDTMRETVRYVKLVAGMARERGLALEPLELGTPA